jgi:L-threonylcarbamoyladenylate synthase
VAAEFGPTLRVLDGGDCALGIESAIVDCTRGAPVLLRPGVLDRAALEQALKAAPGGAEGGVSGGVLRAADAVGGAEGTAPRASGTLAAHYAPNAQLRLMSGDQLRAAFEVLGPQAPQGLAVYSRSIYRAPPGVHLKTMPEQADAVAHELFSVLRDFDADGAHLIWVETPPDGPAWEGVRDRLTRAAAA